MSTCTPMKRKLTMIPGAMTEPMEKTQRADFLDELFDGEPDEGPEAKALEAAEKQAQGLPIKKRKIGS